MRNILYEWFNFWVDKEGEFQRTGCNHASGIWFAYHYDENNQGIFLKSTNVRPHSNTHPFQHLLPLFQRRVLLDKASCCCFSSFSSLQSITKCCRYSTSLMAHLQILSIWLTVIKWGACNFKIVLYWYCNKVVLESINNNSHKQQKLVLYDRIIYVIEDRIEDCNEIWSSFFHHMLLCEWKMPIFMKLFEFRWCY